ncbi:MAG: hypothetical protein M1138_06400 [Candidatus Thermoplasmatota archaeon]|nr:hypothetical protein [Candidatus Thermoplasmatota archaeon]
MSKKTFRTKIDLKTGKKTVFPIGINNPRGFSKSAAMAGRLAWERILQDRFPGAQVRVLEFHKATRDSPAEYAPYVSLVGRVAKTLLSSSPQESGSDVPDIDLQQFFPRQTDRVIAPFMGDVAIFSMADGGSDMITIGPDFVASMKWEHTYPYDMAPMVVARLNGRKSSGAGERIETTGLLREVDSLLTQSPYSISLSQTDASYLSKRLEGVPDYEDVQLIYTGSGDSLVVVPQGKNTSGTISVPISRIRASTANEIFRAGSLKKLLRSFDSISDTQRSTLFLNVSDSGNMVAKFGVVSPIIQGETASFHTGKGDINAEGESLTPEETPTFLKGEMKVVIAPAEGSFPVGLMSPPVQVENLQN